MPTFLQLTTLLGRWTVSNSEYSPPPHVLSESMALFHTSFSMKKCRFIKPRLFANKERIYLPHDDYDERTNPNFYDKIWPSSDIKNSLPILSRQVSLGVYLPPLPKTKNENDDDEDKGEELTLTIWELERPSNLIEKWWSSSSSSSSNPNNKRDDPFGVIMWPGSILASREMGRRHLEYVRDKVVLVLGSGVGIEAQAAAMFGAKKVIATDVNRLVLRLLEFGSVRAGLDDVIETREFDLFSKEKLPECDLVVIADVLYNERLAMEVGQRCYEIMEQNINNPTLKTSILVTDSQRFYGTDFLPSLNKRISELVEATEEELLYFQWEEHFLEGFTGSGILVDDDQTYDTKARLLFCDGFSPICKETPKT